MRAPTPRAAARTLRDRWAAAGGRAEAERLRRRVDEADEAVREHVYLEERLAEDLDRLERTLLRLAERKG